jgi:hypothetical protein
VVAAAVVVEWVSAVAVVLMHMAETIAVMVAVVAVMVEVGTGGE